MRCGETVLITVSDRQSVFFHCPSVLKIMTLITAAEIILQLNSLLCMNRTFPKKFSCCRVCRAHGGFLRHNNSVMGFCHDPGTLRIVHRAGSS